MFRRRVGVGTFAQVFGRCSEALVTVDVLAFERERERERAREEREKREKCIYQKVRESAREG